MTKCQLKSHITDSRFFSRSYATDEARMIFCDLRRMQRWLEVEATLTQCQADFGIIPAEDAKHIVKAADLSLFNLDNINEELARTSHSLIPLLREWQRHTENNSGQYINYGATTQDIQDTAQSLELKDIFFILERDLREIIAILAELAKKHRDLVMIGRTHGQPALPTTLGLKIAGWLDETIRNYNRLKTAKKRVLASQLFGGVGTMSALSEQAFELLEMFSARLDLTVPDTAWHNSRDRLTEYMTLLAIMCGGQARIANEIYQLAKSEVGELAEPFRDGQVGSSTMPHKVNPETCEQVVVLARLVKANASLGFDSLINEHERDYRAVRLEWVTVAESSTFSCNCLSLIKKILGGLVVNESQITKNLKKQAQYITTEALMFKLGEKFGKQSAHEIIYKASMKAHKQKSLLLDTLICDENVKKEFAINDLQSIISPADQLGMAGRLTDRVIEKARQLLAFQTEKPTPPTRCPLINFCTAKDCL